MAADYLHYMTFCYLTNHPIPEATMTPIGAEGVEFSEGSKRGGQADKQPLLEAFEGGDQVAIITGAGRLYAVGAFMRTNDTKRRSAHVGESTIIVMSSVHIANLIADHDTKGTEDRPPIVTRHISGTTRCLIRCTKCYLNRCGVS